MTSSTRVPAVIAALVTRFTAVLATADPPVAVRDGPKVTGEAGPLTLWVGVDDIDTATPIAANSEKQWMPGMSRVARTEELTVHCTIQAKSGGDDVPVLRASVASVLAACEDALAADPSLGNVLPGNRNVNVTGAEWRQYPAGAGMAVRVMFAISASAILGPP